MTLWQESLGKVNKKETICLPKYFCYSLAAHSHVGYNITHGRITTLSKKCLYAAPTWQNLAKLLQYCSQYSSIVPNLLVLSKKNINVIIICAATPGGV